MFSGGNDIGVGEGRPEDTRRDQPGGMGHIDEEEGTDGISDLSHTCVVLFPRVGGTKSAVVGHWECLCGCVAAAGG